MEKENVYDVVIIGGGPAGLTAAIYLARACYRVVVLEKDAFGGQITITEEIVNYPGVEKTSGRALTAQMKRQGEAFGAEYRNTEVLNLDTEGEIKTVRTAEGEFYCFGILLATGAHPRILGFEGEEEFRGRGVAYCATCDGEFFRDREVFVVGGGFAAAEESVFLTKYARQVTVLIREEDFTCAKSVAEKARKNPKIRVLTEVVVERVQGEGYLSSITYRSLRTQELTTYQANPGENIGVFVFAGYEPAVDLVKDQVELSEQGYVITDRNQKTCIDGLYAAGDICVKSLRQVVTAVGDGALAATELERYAANMQKQTGIYPHFQKPQTTQQSAQPLFEDDMKTQLRELFDKMEASLRLVLYRNDQPISGELETYLTELSAMTEKLTVETGDKPQPKEELPMVRICREDGTDTGLAFHGVPGGHEFTSFVMALYNAAGEGQYVEPAVRERIRNLSGSYHIRVLVTLSCTLCPGLVMAVQKIACLSEQVTADIYDIGYFKELQRQYEVMSVPCMIVAGRKPEFGKKDIDGVLDWLLRDTNP